MKKPMIGVVPLVDEERESFWMLPGYFEGIEEAGGIPVMLPLTDDPEAIARLAYCSGVEIGEGLEQVLLVGGIYLALTALLLLLTAPVDTGGRHAYNGKKRKGENRAGDPSHSASL